MKTGSVTRLLGALTVFPLHAGEDALWASKMLRERDLTAIQQDSAEALFERSPLANADRWLLRISPGLSFQRFGKISADGRGFLSSLSVPRLFSSGPPNLPQVGSPTAFDDRTYDDGFVNRTGPTGDTGRTWFWGYDRARQVDGSGNLVMTARGSRSDYREGYQDLGGSGFSDTLQGLASRLDLSLAPPGHLHLPFDEFLVSIAFFHDEAGRDFLSFVGEQALDQIRLETRDTYQTSGLILPQPGYRGNPVGPGITLPNIPLTREESEVIENSESARIESQVSLNFELDSFSLSLGPTFSGPYDEDWQWKLSTGPTLNFYQYRLRQREQIHATVDGQRMAVGNGYRDSKSGNELGIGIFLRGTIARRLTEQWTLETYLQGEFAESFRVSNGVSSFQVDPSGYSVGLATRFTF